MSKTNTIWKNRIVDHADVDPAALVPHPLNFRTHPKNQQDSMAGIIGDIGLIDEVIIQAGTKTIINGHLRVSLAIQQKQATIPVKIVDLTDDEVKLALATFDPISAMAGADAEALDALLREVSTSDAAVMQMLADLAEQEGIVGYGGATDLLTDPDDVPPVPVDPITKSGDLWLLGEHRLLCGDSTNAADVKRLMCGQSFDLLMTDPPYAINAPRMTLGTGKKQFHRGDWDEALIDMSEIVRLAPSVCIWSGNYYADVLPVTNDWLAWHKKNDGLTFSEFELAWTNFGCNTRWMSWFYSGGRTREDPKQHPTQKPVEVIQWAIELAPANQSVLDLFGGSGSTLIACEQTGRRCAMMELDPAYCDVIVTRWENETGKTATREPVTMAAD